MSPTKSIVICFLAIFLSILEHLHAKNIIDYNYNYDYFTTSYLINHVTIESRIDKTSNNKFRGIGGIISFGRLITENIAIESFFDFVHGKINTKSEKYIVTEKSNIDPISNERGVPYRLGSPVIYNMSNNRVINSNEKTYEEYTFGIGSNIVLSYIMLNSLSTNIMLGSGISFKSIEYFLSGNTENNNNKTMTSYKSYVISNIIKMPFTVGILNINHDLNHFINVGLEYQVKYQFDREIKNKENNLYRINLINNYETNNIFKDNRNLTNKGTTLGKSKNIYCSIMIMIKITL